jgi:branched-chain amino acid transport system permease protein
MNGGLVVQALVSGAAAGAIYGLVGLGYGLVYRMSGVLNFAQGDMVTAAVFTFLLVVGGGGAVALTGIALPLLLLGVGVALALSVGVAAVILRVAVAPYLRRGIEVGWIASTLAAGLLLQALVGVRFQAESYTVPDVLRQVFGGGAAASLPGGGVLQLRSVAVLVLAGLLALGFDRWLQASRTGRAMRAAAEDEAAAGLSGVSVPRMRLLAWAIAGVLATTAGLLAAPTRPLTLTFGVVIGLKGTVAAVLGGLGSARGAMVAGLLLGVGETAVTTLYIPAINLGAIAVPRVGPFPSLEDVGPLFVLVLAITLVPRLVTEARGQED